MMSTPARLLCFGKTLSVLQPSITLAWYMKVQMMACNTLIIYAGTALVALLPSFVSGIIALLLIASMPKVKGEHQSKSQLKPVDAEGVSGDDDDHDGSFGDAEEEHSSEEGGVGGQGSNPNGNDGSTSEGSQEGPNDSGEEESGKKEGGGEEDGYGGGEDDEGDGDDADGNDNDKEEGEDRAEEDIVEISDDDEEEEEEDLQPLQKKKK